MTLDATPAVQTHPVPLSEWLAENEERRAAHIGGALGSTGNLWFDLTTAFQWHGGVVGIVRAELEMACGFAKVYPQIRFSMQVNQGLAEIHKDELRWLLDAENVADAFMRFFARYHGTTDKAQSIRVNIPDTKVFFHPYKQSDAIIAVGWMDSQKERYFSHIKKTVPGVYLFYLVYDIILLLDDTKHFYDPVGRERFEGYIEWISRHCDLIFYGGRTAKIDTQAFQRAKDWPVPPGFPVKFGTDIVKMAGTSDDADILASLGITGPFIITVGSLEPRKNHETLYRAYLLAMEIAEDTLPQLVFIGKPMWRTDDMLDTIARDPRLKGRLLCLTPKDPELAALYKNCRFTLLPSLYEGWSLTLPESLGQGKFCLCSDTPPLREIGGDLVDYVDTFDVRAWADKIIRYSTDDTLLASFEHKIVNGWPNTKWSDTARMLLDTVTEHAASHEPIPAHLSEIEKQRYSEPPVIWMDLTTSFLEWTGGISGIVRAELEYARKLKELDPRTRFFAYQRVYDYFFEVDTGYLTWLFDQPDLHAGYKHFRAFWNEHEENNTGFRNPFRQSGGSGYPVEGHVAFLPGIPSHSIVLFPSIDSDGTGTLTRIAKIDELINAEQGVMKSQIIYDLTPILYPQFHLLETCTGFEHFFEHVSNKFDHIVYGGRVAQRDGVAAQSLKNLRIPRQRLRGVWVGHYFGPDAFRRSRG